MGRIGVPREPLSLGRLNKVLFFTILYNVFHRKGIPFVLFLLAIK